MSVIIHLPKPAVPRPSPAQSDAERLRKAERDAALLAGLLPPGSEEMPTSEPPYTASLDGGERR